MTIQEIGFWIAKEELTRQPGTEWNAVPWQDRAGTRSDGLTF